MGKWWLKLCICDDNFGHRGWYLWSFQLLWRPLFLHWGYSLFVVPFPLPSSNILNSFPWPHHAPYPASLTRLTCCELGIMGCIITSTLFISLCGRWICIPHFSALILAYCPPALPIYLSRDHYRYHPRATGKLLQGANGDTNLVLTRQAKAKLGFGGVLWRAGLPW